MIYHDMSRIKLNGLNGGLALFPNPDFDPNVWNCCLSVPFFLLVLSMEDMLSLDEETLAFGEQKYVGSPKQ